MGYAEKIGENIFMPLLVALKAVGDEILRVGHANRQDLSWGKLSLDSDFPQYIAVRA